MSKNRKFLFVFLIILVVALAFFILSNTIFAEEEEIELKNEYRTKIWQAVKQGVTDEITEITVSSDFKIEEQAVLIIIKQAVKAELANYLLVDVPKKIAKEGINTTIKLASFLLTGDPTPIIEEIEKLSVEKAKEYAIDWLLRNEIKVSNGELEVSYRAYDESPQKVILPYSIVYHPLGSERGEVGVEIYSSKTIKTPIPSRNFRWEGGIDELKPFIVRINGEVKYVDDVYKWIKGPQIEMVFDEPVPEMEIEELSFVDKVKSYFQKIETVVGNLWDEVKDIFSNLNIFQAAIAPSFEQIEIGQEEEEIGQIGQEEIEELKIEELSSLENEVAAIVEAGPRPLSIEQAQEILDDIAERVDVLGQQIAELLGAKLIQEEPGQNEGAKLLSEELSSPENEELSSPESPSDGSTSPPEALLASNRRTSSGGGGGGGAAPPPPPAYCSIPVDGQGSRDKVIFSEIAWMGTSVSANNEWIKLKNISNSQSDLSGWQILDKEQQIKVILQGSIGPASFYLLERTDDNTLPGVSADLIYTGALNDTDEVLYLFNNSCGLEDKIEAEPNWPAGDKENKLFMVRDANLNWQTYGQELPEEVLETTTPSASPTIIINEIGWMGTSASSNDEWLELYNPNQETVEIADWQLLFYPKGQIEPRITIFSPIDTATPSIGGLSYFLLERTSDDTIKNIKADYIFKLQGGLNNDGGILELRDDQGNLIDKVDCSGSDGWLAGDKDKKISMERTVSGTWLNNNLIMRQGGDAEGNQIWGTPKAKNSVSTSPTEISTALPFDEFNEITLALLNSPYIIRWRLDVPQDKILTIEPGVVVKFYDNYSRLEIQGTLKAIGTENEKIIFTSLSDEPYSGSWDQIYFGPTSIDSELNNVIVRYGGGMPPDPAGSSCSSDMAGIRAEESSISLKNSVVEKSQYAGLVLINSPSVIDNVQFLDNTVCWGTAGPGQQYYGGSGLAIEGGQPIIKNSVFKRNPIGLSISSGSLAQIENNIFQENEKAVWLMEANPFFSNNSAENNDINGILVLGFGSSYIKENTNWQANLPYVIRGFLMVFENATLELESEARVEFYDNYSGLEIQGTLRATNNVFTSFQENPYPGSWDKIFFSEKSKDSVLDNVVVQYGGGGYGTPCSPNMAGLRVENSLISLKNSVVEKNQYGGLVLINSPSVIDNVQFLDNTVCWGTAGPGQQYYGGSGLAIEGGQPLVKNSVFKRNPIGISIGNSDPILEGLIFGAAEEANTKCNIWKDDQCIVPAPSP